MTNPKVSVVVPTYNASLYIVEALESILSQTFKDFEIIVVDDGSTDNTREILKKYNGKINCYFQKNQGAVRARNSAFELSRGEFIAFLDQDDIWLADNLRKKVLFLDKNPNVPVVTSNFMFFGDVCQKSSFVERKIFLDKKIGDEFIIFDTLGLLLEQCFMFCPTTVVRREVFRKYGGFQIEVSDDYDLFLRISQSSDFGCINNVLVKKRVHNSAATKNYSKNFSSRILALKRVKSNPIIGVDRFKKLHKRMSGTYMSWASHLISDNKRREAREKAFLSIGCRLNFASFKIILLSFGFAYWLRKKVKYAA